MDPAQLATPEASVEARRAVFDAFHAGNRGSHQRLAFYDAFLSGLWDHEKAAPNRDVRSAVHLDADGKPDGVVSYHFENDGEKVRVRDIIATNPEAELALWQFLASIDLVEKVVLRRLSPTSALPWALADPHRLTITKVADFTWLRVLDVPGALAARGIAPCIPSKINRKTFIPHDRALYRQRHRIENMFARLKDWRRIHTRYDRCAHTFLSAIAFAASFIFWLNQ